MANKRQLRFERHVLQKIGEGWRLLSANSSGDHARLASVSHAYEEEVELAILQLLVADGFVKAGAVDRSSGRLGWELTEAGKKALADATAKANRDQNLAKEDQ